MMAPLVPHQSEGRHRVKVYELKHNDWFDRGTGFCFACFVPVEENQPKEPRVIVESEDQPGRRLLETKIVKDDGFQKQQGTPAAAFPPNRASLPLLTFSRQRPSSCGQITASTWP
jgi:protein phosphatase-4 regulatory subunit 3